MGNPLHRGLVSLFLFGLAGGVPVTAQEWDIPNQWANQLSAASGHRLQLSMESRGRYERWRGPARDLDTALFRHRLSLSFKPVPWLKLAGAVRDSRAPGYGPGAPASVRDQADLHEAWFELFPDRKRGFSFSAGRMAMSYGETRLMATSQWGNVPKTFDHARATWRTSHARLDLFFASPIRVRQDMFNRPVLGEHLWGAYSTFAEVGGKHTLDLYALRKQVNRPAGFLGGSRLDGTDRLRIDTFGGRATGPLGKNWKYGLEAAAQTGKIARNSHRAFAWASWLSRRWMLGARNLDLHGEYKYASGAGSPVPGSAAGTFDSLYPSTHDKFGHMDLFGWKNIHYVKGLATLWVTKTVAVNFMYNSSWLASLKDSLYSASGSAIGRSPAGTAGRHVGQETDLFGTFRFHHFLFGAGGGYLFRGEFLRNVPAPVARTYLYVFHTYTF